MKQEAEKFLDRQVAEAVAPLEKELRILREKARDRLGKVVGPGKISPETCAAFLGVSFKTVYRWLAAGPYLPKHNECLEISRFLGLVNEVRAFWAATIKTFSLFEDAPPAGKNALFRQPFLRILESKDSNGRKVNRLTKSTFQYGASQILKEK